MAHDKLSVDSCKRYALKKIGRHWFLEYNENLTNLSFLTGDENVRLDENVIFTNDVMYQIREGVNGSIEVKKIKDAHYSSLYKSKIDQQRYGLNNEEQCTRFEESLKLDCMSDSCNGKEWFDISGGKDVNEKRTKDLESMSDMVSSIEIKSNESIHVDTECVKKPRKLRQRAELSKLFQRNTEVTNLSAVREETKNTEAQPKNSFEKLTGHGQKEFAVLALFSYEPLHADDLNFKEGDTLDVYSELTVNNFEWYIARNIVTGKKGYVPKNYVSINDNSAYCQRWYHDVKLGDVRRFFRDPQLSVGTFLVRGDFLFVLSVKSDADGDLKSYKIRRSDDGGFYISSKEIFDNMLDLIANYRRAANGLCCKLTKAYAKRKPIVHLRNIEVDRQTVDVFGRFGEDGNTYSGKFMKTLDVAVKKLKYNHLKAQKNTFLEGIKLLERLRHDKLVHIFAVCVEAGPTLIMSELMMNGSLLDYLRCETVRDSLRFDTLTDIAAQIAEGMAYLEENKFAHGNLRAVKCLIGESNIVKVSGYGVIELLESEILESDIYQMSNHLPTKWFAPEVYSSRRFNVKSDVWSFGVLLYEIITLGCVPYPGMTGMDVFNEVLKGFRMPKPSLGPIDCPDSYYDMILQCWQKSPDSRPTFAYLQHFFDDFTVCTEPSKVSLRIFNFE